MTSQHTPVIECCSRQREKKDVNGHLG